MKLGRTILILLALLQPVASYAAGNQEDSEDLLAFLYGGLKKIRSFGFIYAHVKNEKENRIGLKSAELTDYLKLRYKNNFGTVPYKELKTIPTDAKGQQESGMLWCGVWTVGDDFPVAYHVECRIGSYSETRILHDEHLGYGNKNNVPQSIKESIEQMVSQFAIQFFKVRGEM